MYKRPSKRKELIQRVSIYSVMTLMVISIVTVLMLIILGYRFDISKGRIEQDALVQFASTPSGASVSVDGKSVGSTTPGKITLPAGLHSFQMALNGYAPWSKSVTLQAGQLTWLNYALLVPTSLPVQSVANYPSVATSLATDDGSTMLIQQNAAVPTFQLIDLTSDTIKSTDITIPASVYIAPSATDSTQTFTPVEWDPGGRYVLVRHTTTKTTEWIVVDTKNVVNSQNLTTSFALTIDAVHFAGTSGTLLYSLSSGDIRKIDLSAGTISRALVSNVTSFGVYGTNVITYVANGVAGSNQRLVGVYLDGDSGPYVLRTTTSSADTPLHVATTNYFNDDYIAIAEGTKVDVLSGNYPSSPTDAKSLKPFASYSLTSSPQTLKFSPDSDNLVTQSGAYFTSYSLEYNVFTQTTIDSKTAIPDFAWLTDNDVWSIQNGDLTIREIDGTNVHTINTAIAGQDATLTTNGRYMYSIGTNKTGFQLQRVRMILQ